MTLLSGLVPYTAGILVVTREKYEQFDGTLACAHICCPTYYPVGDATYGSCSFISVGKYQCFVLQALLEQQLAVERGKMETEKKKFQHAMDEKVTVSFVMPDTAKNVGYFSCIF